MNIKSLQEGKFIKLPTEAWFKLDRIERFPNEDQGEPLPPSAIIEVYMGFELKSGTDEEETQAREYNPPLFLEGDLNEETGEITDIRYYDFSNYKGPVAT